MAFPAEAETITVKAQYLDPSGEPARGKITVVLDQSVADTNTNTIYTKKPLDYELDGNGSVEFDIIKTGSTVSDPLTLTRNVGVKIIEEFTGVKKTTWTTVIDTNAADENGDFQLADAAETSQRPLNQYVLLGTYSAAIATKANIGSVPSTATSAGVPGTIAYNTTHLYICVASNTWRRVSIAAW